MRLRYRGGYSVLILTMVLTLLSGVTENVSARRSKTSEESDRRKARHYYLSAVKQEVLGNSDAGAELFRKAYECDSTYAEAALQYG
ncbi:MAG: hypothetical protein K2J15_02625, partial [Muribaculaceae bacterium]|nr:hypothetical protein [Muribaculaceae bacterium]